MCRTIYGYIGLIVIRMREGYEGGVRRHMDEVGKKTASSSVELGWLSGLGLILVERWSWVRIPLDLLIIFFKPPMN